MKVCEVCGVEIDTRDGENRCSDCESDRPRKTKKQRRSNRRMMDDAMSSLGLVKVRGAMGGVYYE